MQVSSAALLVTLLLVSTCPLCELAAAQEPAGVVTGTVVDSINGRPIANAVVMLVLVDGATVAETRSNASGRFRFAAVAAGRYRLRVLSIGYDESTSVVFSVGETGSASLRLLLSQLPATLRSLVVSVDKTPEPMLSAPASVTSILRPAIVDRVQLTPVAIGTAPGVDISNTGVVQQTFAVRGDRSATSGAMLMLTDYRYAGVPSLGFNVPYLVPISPDDIQRIEIVRGPGSALYGPNAHRGVLHIITRSPFDSTGGSLAIAAGERSLFQGTGRVAARLSDHVAVKVSGDYVRADDWEYVDPRESIPRDFNIKRAAAEGRVDWRSDSTAGATTVRTSFGWAQAFNLVDGVSAVGGVQVRDWRYSYLQARLVHGLLSVNTMYNWTDAGESVLLIRGAPLVDKSRVVAVQVQHGISRATRQELLYGMDARYTEPRTGGTIHGRYENDDEVTELGAYLNGRIGVARTVDFNAAVRVDYHDRLGDVVWSPRLAIVWQPGPIERRHHAVRLTYNRAFNSPDPGDLFPDVSVTSLPGLPYDVRLLGTPAGGFHFRDGGDLCMRSPFAPDPTACLAPDATVTWPAVVRVADSLGVDLSQIPAPDATQVGTAFRVLDIDSESFVPADINALSEIAPRRRTITTTVEGGYKGDFGRSLSIAVDVYHNWIKDGFGPQYVATPNAFYDPESLAGYLAQFMPADSALAIAGLVGQVPAGTITPWESGTPDLLVFEPQGGTVTFWGVDVAVAAKLGPASVSASYSWVSDDSIPNVTVAGSYVLNGPRNKASAGVTYRDPRSRFHVGIEGRLVASFPVVSGMYEGRVDEYGVLDAWLGVAVPGLRNVEASVDARNLLDNRHREFVGAPAIGRLVMARLRASF